jgi:hypothetical protein
MTRTRFGRLWFAGAALLAAIPGSALFADEVLGPKDLLCAAAQCYNGDRKCADVKGEIKNPMGTGTISVTYYCYEAGRARPGDDTDSII